MCFRVYVFPCSRVSVFLHGNSKCNRSRNMKLEYILVKYLGQVRYWALPDQGQGHAATLKFFSIYSDTNCQVP